MGLVRFVWSRAREGYTCREVDGDCRIVPDTPPGRRPTMIHSEPLEEHTGLFRTFALLGSDREAILRFAASYGLLGWDHFRPMGSSGLLSVGSPPTIGESSTSAMSVWWDQAEQEMRGETLLTWVLEIESMKRAVDLWDAVSRRDARFLIERMRPGDRLPDYGPWRAVEPRAVSSISSDPSWKLESDAFIAARHTAGDVVHAAMLDVEKWLNHHLWAHTALRAYFSPDTGQIALHAVPKHLLGALWLQFARSIEGNKRYRKCANPECGEWFEVGAGRHGRPEKLYHSGTCRSRAFRKRREQEGGTDNG